MSRKLIAWKNVLPLSKVILSSTSISRSSLVALQSTWQSPSTGFFRWKTATATHRARGGIARNSIIAISAPSLYARITGRSIKEIFLPRAISPACIRFHTSDVTHSLRIWTVPNLICMARISATPYISYLILQGNYEYALYGFIIAGISDGLDGFIARNFNQKSILGSYLDPLSDKILINTLVVTCTVSGLLPAWLVGTVVFRDCLLVGGAAFQARKVTKQSGDGLLTGTFKMDSPLEIKASPLSKVNTVLQLSCIGLALSSSAFEGWTSLASTSLFFNYTTACTTVASLLEYAVKPGYVSKDVTRENPSGQ